MHCHRPVVIVLAALVMMAMTPATASAGGDTRVVPTADWPTLQSAIDASIDGDTVLLLPGVLSGPGNAGANTDGRSISILGQTGTIIDGGGSITPLIVSGGDVVLERLVLRNGDGVSGGGLRVTGGADVTADQLEVRNSTALAFGGGVFVDQSSTLGLRNSTISGCSAPTGGGIAAILSTISLIDVTVSNNAAAQLGGGLSVLGGALHSLRVQYEDNVAEDGAALSLQSIGRATVTQGSIRFNEATGQGGNGNIVSVLNGTGVNMDAVSITNNVVGFSGTAMDVVNSTVTMRDTTVRTMSTVPGGTEARAYLVSGPDSDLVLDGGVIGPGLTGTAVVASGQLTLTGSPQLSDPNLGINGIGGRLLVTNATIPTTPDVAGTFETVELRDSFLSTVRWNIATVFESFVVRNVQFGGVDARIRELGVDQATAEVIDAQFDVQMQGRLHLVLFSAIDVRNSRISAGVDDQPRLLLQAGPGGTIFGDDLTVEFGTVDGFAPVEIRGPQSLLRDVEVHSTTVLDAPGGIAYVGPGVHELDQSLIRDNTTNVDGGGVGVSETATVTVQSSEFRDNQAGGIGGGVVVHDAGHLILIGSTLTGNTAEDGGGVGVDGGSVTADGTTATGNEAAGRGGNIALMSGSLSLDAVTVSAGLAGASGGGIHVEDGSLTMTGGLIQGNLADVAGGGLAAAGGTVMLTGTTVADNRSQDGAAIRLGGDAMGTLVACDVTGNEAGPETAGSILQIEGEATAHVEDMVATDNHIAFAGSVVRAAGTTATFVDCTIADLSSIPAGGNTTGFRASGTGAEIVIDGGTIGGGLIRSLACVSGRVRLTGILDVASTAQSADGDDGILIIEGADLPNVPDLQGSWRRVEVVDSFLGTVRWTGVPIQEEVRLESSSVTGLECLIELLSFEGADAFVDDFLVSLAQPARLHLESFSAITLNQVTISGGQDDQPRVRLAATGSAGVVVDDLTVGGGPLMGSSPVEISGVRSRLTGVSIEDAEVDGGTEAAGAIEFRGAGDHVLRQAFLSGNTTSRAGGAILVRDGALLVVAQSDLLDNVAQTGGAIAVRGEGSSATVLSSRLDGNSAVIGGAGTVALGGALRIESSLVTENTALGGGALAVSDGTLEIVLSTLAENAADSGSAVLVSSTTGPVSATLTGSIVTGDPKSLIEDPDAVLDASDSIVLGGLPTGRGIRDVDPSFVDPAGGDWSLRGCSPAIDAGPTPALSADTLDLDGDGVLSEPLSRDAVGGARVLDAIAISGGGEAWPGTDPALIADLGAIEFDPASGGAGADVNGDGAVDLTDLLEVLAAFGPCEDCTADTNCSGTVDFQDLLAVLSAWGI